MVEFRDGVTGELQKPFDYDQSLKTLTLPSDVQPLLNYLFIVLCSRAKCSVGRCAIRRQSMFLIIDFSGYFPMRCLQRQQTGLYRLH